MAVLVPLADRRFVDVHSEARPLRHRQITVDRRQRFLVDHEIQEVVPAGVVVNTEADLLDGMVGRAGRDLEAGSERERSQRAMRRDRHVERLRGIYGRKRDVFLEALDRFFKPFRGEVTWTRPQGGLFVWMTMPEGVDTGFDGPLFTKCLAEGVIYVPGEFAFAPEPGPLPRNHMRLTFGVPDEETLVEGARRLADAVCSTLSPTATA